MELHSICEKAEPIWKRDLYCAYLVTDKDGVKKTVFCYQIPLDNDPEMVLLQKSGVSVSDRIELYENLLSCIQHQIDVSAYLTARKVPSVLEFTNLEQHRVGNTTFIYLETEEVYPVTERIFRGTCSRTEVLDVLIRLSMILRDMNSPEIGVTHRGFDLSEVYLNQENKILLGGFYYACGPKQEDGGTDLSRYPTYLPLGPAHLTPQLLQGERGSYGQDIRMLAQVGWNLFSGDPFDAEQIGGKTVFPEYATEAIADALLLGLSGKDEFCNSFRRKLLECRKALNQDKLADFPIPIAVTRLKAYREEYIQP